LRRSELTKIAHWLVTQGGLVSIRKFVLSLAALGLVSLFINISQPAPGVPGLADRDFRGNDGKGD
jgi:hypothetical protein